MPGYHPSSKEDCDRAGNDLADASYPFLAELTNDPHDSVEQLLSKKSQSFQSKRSCVAYFEVVLCTYRACGNSSTHPRWVFPNLRSIPLATSLFVTSTCPFAWGWNLVPPGAIGSGPTISIPYCEKGHTDIIDVISCFGFLGTGDLMIFDTTDRDPACIPHDPWCNSWMMFLACAAPTHLNHGDKYDLRYNVPSISLYNGALIRRFLAFCGSAGSFANCRNSRTGIIQLSSSSWVTSATSFCVIDFSCSTSTRTYLASLENVIEASLLRASAFLF
ncbi:hypothetical protein Tco_0715112 [Tanacetum coccineum]